MPIKSLLVSLAAAATLLTACSAGPAVTTPAAGASQPGATSSAAVTLAPGSEVSVDDFVNRIASGLSSMSSYQVVMTMNAATGSMKATSDIDTSVKPQSSHTVLDMGGKSMEMISIGGEYFIKGLTGSGWAKVSAAQAAGMGSNDDPVTQLQQNRDAITKVTMVGQETVDGAPADHYRVEMDLTKVKGGGSTLTGTMTYDAWVNAENRMVKVSVTSEGKPVLEGTMGRFNEPVDIKAPEKYTELPG